MEFLYYKTFDLYNEIIKTEFINDEIYYFDETNNNEDYKKYYFKSEYNYSPLSLIKNNSFSINIFQYFNEKKKLSNDDLLSNNLIQNMLKIQLNNELNEDSLFFGVDNLYKSNGIYPLIYFNICFCIIAIFLVGILNLFHCKILKSNKTTFLNTKHGLQFYLYGEDIYSRGSILKNIKYIFCNKLNLKEKLIYQINNVLGTYSPFLQKTLNINPTKEGLKSNINESEKKSKFFSSISSNSNEEHGKYEGNHSKQNLKSFSSFKKSFEKPPPLEEMDSQINKFRPPNLNMKYEINDKLNLRKNIEEDTEINNNKNNRKLRLTSIKKVNYENVKPNYFENYKNEFIKENKIISDFGNTENNINNCEYLSNNNFSQKVKDNNSQFSNNTEKTIKSVFFQNNNASEIKGKNILAYSDFNSRNNIHSEIFKKED